MTIQEAFNLVDIEKYNNGFNHPNSEELGLELGLGYVQWEEVLEIDEYPIYQWLCTDTYVGMHVLVMDGDIIAVTVQEGRKCGKHYMWKDQETANEVRELIIEKYMLSDAEYKVITFKLDDGVVDLFNRCNQYGCIPNTISDEMIENQHKN